MPVPGTTIERGAITSDADIGVSASQMPYAGQSENDQKLAEKIVRRQSRLEDERQLVESQWDMVDEFIIARRAVWDLGQRRGRLVGEKVGEKIYDGTAAGAGQDLADGLQGQSASAGLVWWAAHFRNKLAQKDYIARQWIDEIQDGASTEMAQSDLYRQLNQAYQDAVFMGTATMAKPIWRSDLSRLVYRTHHPREIYIARDDDGIINLWHRKFPMTNRNIADKFGMQKLNLQLRQQVEQNPYGRRMVIHAIFLNTERDTRKWTSENKKIASVYVLENEKLILRKSGFDDWPLCTWSWRLDSQETYGRGPAMDTLFEAASTNSAMHYLLDAAQLSVQKPMTAQESLKNKIKISPWGITWLAQGEQPPRELFNARSEYPIGVDQLMKLREELRDKFKSKTFMLLSQLTAQTQRMNMMQIGEIQGEKAAMLGPIVTPNQAELLCPLINATVSVLMANGRLPPPPPSLARYANSPVDLEFLGPIAVAQKRYLQMQGINPFLSRLVGDTPLLQVWPEMKDKVKADELFDYLFESDGAPSKLEQDPATLQQIRLQKQKMQQQQMQLTVAEKAAKIHKDTTQAPEPGSPAEQATGGGQ